MSKLIICLIFALSASAINKIVYYQDDRMNIEDVASRYQFLRHNTAAMVSKKKLKSTFDGYRFNSNSNQLRSLLLGNQFENGKLCSGEKFLNETRLSSCSGFLISNQYLLTAGHCMTKKSCQNSYWVFDYNSNVSSLGTIAKSNVYNCKKVIAKKSAGLDFALIKLDRANKKYKATRLKSIRNLKSRDELFIAGHPSNLPLKIAGNAYIKSKTSKTFRATLDSFAGNSGSGVYSDKDLSIVGILISGDTDYVMNREKGCFEVNKCRDKAHLDSACRGETVLRIDSVLEFIEHILD